MPLEPLVRARAPPIGRLGGRPIGRLHRVFGFRLVGLPAAREPLAAKDSHMPEGVHSPDACTGRIDKAEEFAEEIGVTMSPDDPIALEEDAGPAEWPTEVFAEVFENLAVERSGPRIGQND